MLRANPRAAAGEVFWVRASCGEANTSRVISQVLTAISAGLEINFANVASGSDVTWIELVNYALSCSTLHPLPSKSSATTASGLTGVASDGPVGKRIAARMVWIFRSVLTWAFSRSGSPQ